MTDAALAQLGATLAPAIIITLLIRSIYLALGDIAADIERRRNATARRRKARRIWRYDRKAWAWFAIVDVLAVTRPKGPAHTYARTRADDLYDRSTATARKRLDAFAPRVMWPLPANTRPATARRRRRHRHR